MKTTVELPADATRWLRRVNLRLRPLASDKRAEIVDGLRGHLVEAIADGEASADVIARLGKPADVAKSSIVESRGAGEGEQLPRYLTAKRAVQILAVAFLAVGSITVLNHSGGTMRVSGPDLAVSVSYPQSVLQFWGLAIVVPIAILIAVVAAPLGVRGRAWQSVSIASAVLLTLAAVLVWAMAGFYLFPAAAAAIVAVFLRPRRVGV